MPWWPTTDPWRHRWRPQVEAFWRDLDLGPVTVVAGEEGIGRNAGIRASDADVIVSADADAIVAPDAARAAVLMAAEKPGLVVPHDRFVFLSQAVCTALTVREAAGAIVGWRWPDYRDAESMAEYSVGGIVVFSRATWEQAGGYDEGIVRGYDGAFAVACGSLVGEQRRMRGDLIHFWHQRPEDKGDPWAQVRAYEEAAREGPDAMRAHIASR